MRDSVAQGPGFSTLIAMAMAEPQGVPFCDALERFYSDKDAEAGTKALWAIINRAKGRLVDFKKTMKVQNRVIRIVDIDDLR